ncbi:MAG: hypothetical protein JSV84_01400 [Gemmatimonadota bacterium]|nr:MAG: hypothetical protein JSV84_01400 [Gemmatimonadota bacterium]
MLSCHDMKAGDIYICEECGLELQVVKECSECETSTESCGCEDTTSDCVFSCCGKELLKK